MNMLQRARRALTEPNDYSPFHDNANASLVETGERIRQRIFVVPDSLKFDPSDISGNFARAALENTEMTTPIETLVDGTRASLSSAMDQLTQRRAGIVTEQTNSDAEFKATIDQLNDQIKSLTETHDDATTDFVTRIGDADAALASVSAGLAALPPIVAGASGGGGASGSITTTNAGPTPVPVK